MLPLRTRRRTAGSSLIPTLLVVMAVVTFVSLAASLTSQFGRMASMQQGNDEAMAGADSALEYVYSFWKGAVNAKGNTAPTNSYLRQKATGVAAIPPDETTPVSLTSLAASFANFSTTGTVLNNLTIQAVDADGKVATPNLVTRALDGQNTQNVPDYPGWAGRTYYYKAVATVSSKRFGVIATNPDPTKNGVTVTRYFQFTNVPLFQAAIFYENKLEIYPGADMNVTGLVHTNADIWAQPFSSGGTTVKLQFNSNVSHIGGFNEASQYSELKYGWAGGTTAQSQANIPYYCAPANAQDTWADGQLSSSSTAKANQLHQVSAIDPFGGASQNNNGLRDMIEPADGNSSNQKVVNKATVIISVDSSKPVTDATRVSVTGGNGAILTPNDIANIKQAITAAPPSQGGGAVTAPPAAGQPSNGVIYDQREANNVYVTDVDMGRLERALAGRNPVTNTLTASALAGGVYSNVVYIADSAGTTTDSLTGLTEGNRAIRLKNGADLSNDGGSTGVDTTIASDNAVYIQGDFNVGSGTVPSNSAYNASTASTDHYVSNYQRASCAVMADAVTVLSNSFQDSRSNAADFSNRTAAPTTVNCAILAGDVPTNRKDTANPNGNGYASGGAHNFPRFLENWTNVNFTYWGSLVEAFRSERATGVWQTGNVYHWPNRRWSFDTQFLTRAPLGTPQGVQFARGRWERSSL